MAAVVAQRSTKRLRSKTLEVVGSIPVGCLVFSALVIPQQCVHNRVPQGVAALLILFNKKMNAWLCCLWQNKHTFVPEIRVLIPLADSLAIKLGNKLEWQGLVL